MLALLGGKIINIPYSLAYFVGVPSNRQYKYFVDLKFLIEKAPFDISLAVKKQQSIIVNKYSLARIKLNRPMAQIIINSKQNSFGYTELFNQGLELDGPFGDTFKIFASEDQQAQTFYVLTPEIKISC